MSFEFDFDNRVDYSDYLVSVHFVLTSMDSDGNTYTSNTYELIDLSKIKKGTASGKFSVLTANGNKLSVETDYESLLAESEYSADYDTVITHAGIRLLDRVSMKYGYTVEYDFTYRNDDYKASVCDGIYYGLLDSSKDVYLDNNSRVDYNGVPTSDLAKNEYSYSSTMDSYASISEPRWGICFEGLYENSFWESLQFWKKEVRDYSRWDYQEFYFDFTLLSEHENEVTVGWDLSFYDLVFDFTFSSYDENGELVESTYSSSYTLRDQYNGTNFYTYKFKYRDLFSNCALYNAGYATVLKSVRVTLVNTLFNLSGTSAVFDFKYKDDNYVAAVVDSAVYSTYNKTAGKLPLGFNSEIFRLDGDVFSYFYTLVPGSDEEQEFLQGQLIRGLLIKGPVLIYDLVLSFFNFMFKLPGYFAFLFPFLPSTLVAAMLWVGYVGIVFSIFRLLKGKGGD